MVDLSTKANQLLTLRPSPKEDSSSFSDIIPSCRFQGPIHKKITQQVGDITQELCDTNDKLITNFLNYCTRALSVDQELCEDFEKLRKFPAERFTGLEMLVLKFQLANAFTSQILQCTMKSDFCNQGPRND